MNSKLIQQVRVLDPVSDTDEIADVLIVDRTIEAIAPQISGQITDDTEVIDGRGLILGPGLVDLYSHSGEPGFEERETLRSLMQAASAGGFTRLAILPDTTPPVDHPTGVAGLQAGLKNLPQNSPQVLIWGALTMGTKGEQMTEFAELANSGVVGFTDGQPMKKLGLLRRTLEYVQPLGLPIALWPCDRDLGSNGSVREGKTSIRLGLVGSPAIAETSALAAILEIVAATGTPVHLMRISTARSVELIRAAKAQGLPITASTTWMHLLLNVTNISGNINNDASCTPAPAVPYDASLHLDPPLGNPEDQVALISAVADGAIDLVAIDHSPYTYEETHVAFAESPPGAIGLELALPLLWQNLVETGKLSPLQLWRVLSTNPAECLQQKPATLTSGSPAELTLFDSRKTWNLEISHLASRSHNTPWLGQTITGQVLKTFQP